MELEKEVVRMELSPGHTWTFPREGVSSVFHFKHFTWSSEGNLT